MKKIIIILCVFVLRTYGQDSSKVKKTEALKRNEIGLNILPPLLVLAGSTGNEPSYFNATYRYLLHEHHALRFTAGTYVFNSSINSSNQEVVFKNNSLTINKMTTDTKPINVQAGIGYERIFGKRKLKHVFGIDLTYNYLKSSATMYYFGTKDTVYNNLHHQSNVQIDTGKVAINNYYHKFGITPSYSIRYAISKKWLITASVMLNCQAYKIKNAFGTRSYYFDVTTSGLLSAVSLFYRF